MAGLTKRAIDAARRNATREQRLWDDDPRGLFVRIKPSGVATFFLQYTSPITGKKVRHRIAQYGQITLDEARIEARKVLGRVARDEDPARERRQARAQRKLHARTVSELCDRYMADADAGLVTYRGRAKKPSTLAIDRGRIVRHIKPLLGEKLIQDVTAADVEAFFHAVRRGETAATVKTGKRGVARVTGGETAAARSVDLLGSIFSYAIRGGLRPDNPVARFERPPSRRRDRMLSPDDYRALGKALDALQDKGANPVGIAAIRALALTGCRRGEIMALRCDQIDAHRQVLRLDDTKTGQQLRPIGRAALDVLEAARTGFTDRRRKEVEGRKQPVEVPFLFPAARGLGPLVDAKLFRRVAKAAGLDGVTIHTLRHGYASVALELGYSELTIAGLLGHRLSSVTSRYAHHVDRALVAAAERVAGRIEAMLEGREATAEVVPLPQAG